MNIKEITQKALEKLLGSDRYGRIYNSKKEYMPLPKDVLAEFKLPVDLAKVGQSTLIQKAAGEEVESFSSYVLESHQLNDEVIEGFSGVVGVLINSSSNKISVYSGVNAHACTNLNIFGAEHLKEMSLTGSMSTFHKEVEIAKERLFSQLQEFKRIKEEMEAVTYTPEEFKRKKGELLSALSLDLFPYLKHAEGEFRDKNSIYFNWENSDWKLLSGMTDMIKDESPSKRVNSTVTLEKYFKK